ncbi:hypothetical protein AB0N05_37585 [Nocardia sp. NPDC051030]|uniref:hypothetical protein n=1 Tax=Nocardia sp. NPDC051030 TaxID=3155162 RepID=UPI003428A988
MPADQHPFPELADYDDEPPSRAARIRAWARAHYKLLLLAALAIALLIMAVLHHYQGDARTPDPSADVTTPTIAPTWASPGTDADRGTPLDQRDQVLAVARGFATDFATPGSGHQDWWSRVTRWTTTYLADQYNLTDWSRVDQATLIDMRAENQGPTVVDTIATYTDGSALAIRVEHSDGRWKVSTVVPMRTAY